LEFDAYKKSKCKQLKPLVTFYHNEGYYPRGNNGGNIQRWGSNAKMVKNELVYPDDDLSLLFKTVLELSVNPTYL